MSRYKAYSAYRNSGVEWLGEVPAHWEVKCIRYVVDAIGDIDHFMPPSVEKGVPYLMTGDLKDCISEVSLDDCKQVSHSDYKELSKRIKTSKGDVVMARYATIGTLMYVDVDVEILVSYSCVTLKTNQSKMIGTYLFQYMKSDAFRQGVEHRINTNTQGNVGIKDLQEMKVAMPPSDEQAAIAAFLDHETAKIDALIEKQQRLIELLKEKRQAVISHAVIKGLNPNAPMKDSGVEWLGEVPAHWSLPKVKWFFCTESGGTPNTAKHDDYYLDGTIPWIRTTDLNNDELYETPINITKKAVVDSACALLPVNSVLVAMYGGAGSIGKHALLKFESAINQAVCAILPNPKIGPEFLHLYVEFYRPYWMVGAEGTRKDPNINQDVIRELIVPCPPDDEQRKIVETIKVGLSKIDSTIKRCETNIALIQERRTALISAAVTGKIDVRDWQAVAVQEGVGVEC